MFEKIVLEQLKHETLRTIPKEQFASRKKKHSYELQTLRLVEAIQMAKERKEVTGAVFFDVAKVFDKIWHNGLLHKLKEITSPKITKILKSYHDRTSEPK